MLNSTRDMFRRGRRRLAARGSSPVRRRWRLVLEQLEEYALLSPLATATTLSAGPDSGIPGQSVTFTATIVPASGTGIPTGNVQFNGIDNMLVLDPVEVPVQDVDGQAEAVFTVSVSGGGPITIDASYQGDSAFAASAAMPLTVAPMPLSIAEVDRSPKGVTSIALAVDAPLDVGTIKSTHLYHLLGAVQENGQPVFRKKLEIRSVSASARNHTVTIALARPYQGMIEVTVQGRVKRPHGSSGVGPFSIIVS